MPPDVGDLEGFSLEHPHEDRGQFAAPPVTSLDRPPSPGMNGTVPS